MAKVKFSADDNFGMGSDLDLDFNDFPVTEQQIKDDRSPVIKYTAAVGRGVKDYASDPANYERVIRQAMPKGYGAAADLASQTHTELKGLYNSVADELRPAVNTARQTVGKFMPKIEQKAPRFVSKMAKKFADGAVQGYGAQRDFREDEMQRMLDAMFVVNKQQQDDQNKIDDTKENIKQATDQIRHKDMVTMLDEIRKSTAAVAQYNNAVNFSVQKKTLELGFRKYWVMADLLKEVRANNRIIQNQNKTIIKNTGLPDYVKTTMNERFHETVRNRFLDQARDTMFAGTKDYIRRFGRNLRTNVMDKLKPAAQGADAAMQMAQMGADMPDEGGASLLEQLVSFAAKQGTGLAADYASDKLKPVLAKSRTAKLNAARAGYQAGRVGETVNDALNDPTRPWAGPLEFLREMLANAAPTKQGESNIETDRMGRLNRPTPFNAATAKSINEIIPGYLAHIHRELRTMRTGKESPLMTYDFTKNQFSDKDGTGQAIKSLFTGRTAQRAQGNANQILDMIDRSGNLTPEQRELARRKIMERVVTGESMDVANVTRAGVWGSGEDGKAIAGAFKRYLRPNDEGKITDNVQSMNRQAKINELYGNISSSLPDPRSLVQTSVNLGQREVLIRAGVMTEDNRIDRMALARLLNGEDANKNATGAAIAAAAPVFGMTGGLKHGHDGRVVRPSPVEQMQSKEQTQSTDDAAKRLSLLEQLALRKEEERTGEKTINPQDCCFTVDKFDESKRLTSMDATLLRIEELLKDSSDAKLQAMYHIYRRQANPKDNEGEPDGDEGDGKSFKTLWGYAKTRGRSAIKKGWALGKKISEPITSRLPGWMTKGKHGAIDLGNRLSSALGDIHMPGEVRPRISMAAMKAGKYFDKTTNKVITSIDDIKGDVIDAAGNTVITLEELKQSYVAGTINKKLVDVSSHIRGLLVRGKDLIAELVPSAVRTVVSNARNVIDAIKEKMPPYDVYLDGQMDKPILYASLMRYGKYFSKKTAKPIKHPRDIDGEVVDADGNYVVNEDQLKQGLVDINRAPITNFVGRLVAKATKFVKAGANALATIGGAAMGAAGEFMKKFGNWSAEFMVPFREVLSNSSKQVQALHDIYDLLNDRLPGPRKVRGDADGDGVRDGSAKDIRNKQKEEEKEKSEKEATEDKKTGGGLISKLMAGIGGLMSKKDKDKDDDDDDDGDTNIYGGSVDAGGDGDKKDKKGKKGKKGKTGASKGKVGGGGKKGLLRRLGSGAWRTAGAVGRGALTVGKAVLTPSAAVGSALLGAGRLGLAGAGAAASAIPVIGGALAATGGALATVAGALFTWPALAVVGIGAAGYMAYKYSQKTKLTPLSKIRLVQYGAMVDNQEAANMHFELEKLHYDALSMSQDGQIKIDPKKIDPKEVFKLYGVADQRTYGLFERWYKQRFVPVFRKHMQKLWEAKKGAVLKDVESVIPAESKLDYVNTTTGGLEDAHNFSGGWNAAYPRSQTDNTDVRNAVSDVTALLMRENNKKPGSEKMKAQTQEEVNSVSRMSAEELAKRATEKQAGYIARDKEGNELSDISATDLAAKIRKGEATVTVAVATPQNLLHVESNRLDAMTSIRFKAYGLTAMVYAKVRCLGALEMMVEKSLLETPAGIKMTAQKEDILKIAGSAFGVGNVSGEHGRNWITWFNGRFLPVFLLYSSAVRKLTKKTNNADAVKSLPITKQLEVARSIVGASGVGASGSSSPVWNNPTSPWMDGEPLNDDPNSTAGNMETIRVLADKIVLQEATSSPANNTEQRKNADPEKAAFGLYGGTKRRTASSQSDGIDTTGKTGMGVQASGDMVAGAKGSGGTMGGSYGAPGAMGQTPPKGTSGSSGSASGAAAGGTGSTTGGGAGGDAKPLTGIGSAMTVTNGNGSSYDKMDPGNADGWEALKKTINQAAAIVGIDPKTLAAMISIESGFRRAIKPIRNGKLMSSAEGLGQFLDGTWKQMMNKYGKQYGIPPGTPKSDARASALMTAAYIKDNLAQLKGVVNRPYTATDAYIMHFFGPGDGRKFLRAAANENASIVVPTPARQHPEYFFDKGRPRTVQEVYKILTDRLTNTPKRFGVKDSDFGASSAALDDKKNPEAGAGTEGGGGGTGSGAAPTGPGQPGADMAGPPSSAAPGASKDAGKTDATSGSPTGTPGAPPGTPDAKGEKDKAGAPTTAPAATDGDKPKEGAKPGQGVAPGRPPKPTPTPNIPDTSLKKTREEYEATSEMPPDSRLRKTKETMTGQEEGRVRVNIAIEEERQAALKKAREEKAAKAAASMRDLQAQKPPEITPEVRAPVSTVQTPDDTAKTSEANTIRPRASAPEAPAVEQAVPKAIMPMTPQTPEERHVREKEQAKSSLASDDKLLMAALHTNGGYLQSLVGLVNDIKLIMAKEPDLTPKSQSTPSTGRRVKPESTDKVPAPMSRDW